MGLTGLRKGYLSGGQETHDVPRGCRGKQGDTPFKRPVFQTYGVKGGLRTVFANTVRNFLLSHREFRKLTVAVNQS